MALYGSATLRALRRYRAGVIALFVTVTLVGVLNGVTSAHHSVWFPVLDAPGPSPRYGTGTSYDIVRAEMVIFGGGNGTQRFDDTWGWNNFKWVNRNPVHHPSKRVHPAMTYDAARKQVVLFGGEQFNAPPLDDTWVWDGVDWTQLDPPNRPPARGKASMAYDAHRKVVVMFGGSGPGGPSLGDTWTWNGSNWRKMPAAVAPSPRHSAAMDYDVCRGEAVLFGGQGVPSGSPGFTSAAGETWTWNGAKWTQKQPLVSPQPRMGGVMTYSPFVGRLTLYGGFLVLETGTSPGTSFDEYAWTWNGTKWEKDLPNWEAQIPGVTGIAPVFYPPPRAYATWAHDLTRPGINHLFGGIPVNQSAAPALGDQWRFHETYFGFTSPVLSPLGCTNPVPLPPDDAPAGGGSAGNEDLRPRETRAEIKEIGRLSALLGANRKGLPPGTPVPDCPRRQGSEDVSNTHLTTDPKRNRVYQFFVCDPTRPYPQPAAPPRVLIEVYDGATLKPLASAIASLSTIGEVKPDPVRGRFLMRLNRSGGQDLWIIRQDLIEKGVDPVAGKITVLNDSAMGNVNNVVYYNHAKTGRAKLLVYYATSANLATGAQTVTVVQRDVDANREDWRRQVDGCAGGSGTLLMRTEDRVYTTCYNRNFTAVVRIPVAEAPDDPPEDREQAGDPEVFPGPPYAGRAWGDAQAERVVLLSDVHLGQTVWTFDGKTSRYVGRAGVSLHQTVNGYGFDEETGRLYVLVPDHGAKGGSGAPVQGGLRVLDTRLTPVPQAVNFGQFTHLAQAAIGILPPNGDLPRRVFVRRAQWSTPSDPDDPNQRKFHANTVSRYTDGEIVLLEDEMHYFVLADSLPLGEQPEIGRLDALTVPVAANPGKTEVSFDAEGSGYGIRLRSVGGIASALRPPPQGGTFTQLHEQNEDLLFRTELSPPCLYTDRELLAGWVSEARLSDLETSAHSSGLEVDSSSKSDLEGPFTRCLPAKSPAGLPPSAKVIADVLWPLLPFTELDNAVGPHLDWDKQFRSVECVGDSNSSHQATLGDISGSATCKQRDGRVEGSSRGAALGSVPAGYSVAEGNAKVVVGRDPDRGVVVTSTAVAKGIQLGPLSIAMVQTEAVSWSNGRPSEDARATFTRKICGVQFPDYSNSRCLTAAEQKQMADQWNARWGANSKMTLPTPDADFFRGSPGGYIAGVTKPVAEEIENQLASRDFQKEVPGLEITFYKDSIFMGPGRQILQLAAVRTVAGLGVQCQSHLVYSPSAKDCVLVDFSSGPFDQFGGEGEESFVTDSAFDSILGAAAGGEFTKVASPPARSIGRLFDGIPVLRLLPIREVGEALVTGSVWLILLLPLCLASRRFAVIQVLRR